MPCTFAQTKEVMKQEKEKYFAGLTAEQIANERPGKWGDYELLDVWYYFMKEAGRERETAVLELILHSPEQSQMVDYDELYYDVAQNYRLEKEYTKAIGWLYAAIAYEEQHDPSADGRLYWRNSLAETYLYARELDAGLTIFTQNLQSSPHNLDTYNIAAYTLADVGLPDLTLEVVDRAFAVAAIVEDEVYHRQWEDLRQEATVAAEKGTSLLAEIDEAVLSPFRAALALPNSIDPDEDMPQPLLPPIDQLATADPTTVTALTDEILAQGKMLTPELIRLAFSDLDTSGPGHAIALLRRLRDEEKDIFQELSPWLDKADDGWQETLSQSMGKIGGFTTAELKAIAADIDYFTFIRTGATEALSKRPDQKPELHEEIVAFFRHLLNRPEAYAMADEEEFVGFLIGDIEDADLRELYPDIKRAFVEDRVDPQVIHLSSVEGKWELPITMPYPRRQEGGMTLLLECTVCGRKRFHFTRHVLVDTISLEKQREGEPVEFDAHILDHEIICPKCGSVDQYRLTSQAHIALLGQQPPEKFLAMFTGQEPEKVKPNPRVHYRGARALGGPMHPLKAVQRYQQLTAAQPDKANLHMRLGGVFLFVMRFEQGLACLRYAYELAPDDIEVVIRLAMAEHDFGDRAQAKAMYQQVFHLARQDMFSTEMMEVAAHARDGLKALQEGDYSAMDIPISARVYYGESEKPKSTYVHRDTKMKKSNKRRR
jgi:tetratricopeptide (TPR) repeat protein